ncbi:MAG: tRNA (N(6)-L-threonylcarbamoyladenosine(37)-C(2))-methylthiotransferase MtaB [Nitrospirota bacterium]
MKVTLLTLGCRVNQSESAIIEATLRKKGVSVVGLEENPDYCLVNTCTVTSKSDYNSRQLIRRAARAGAKVIVTGCYSQLRPEEIKKIRGVHGICDNNNKYDVIDIFTTAENANDKSSSQTELTENPEELFFGSYSQSRPYLKVQDGCNFRCSYCSVPLARGRSRSIPLKEVIRRAQEIELYGYKEIVLTGIHLGAYGHDLSEKTDINSLIKKLLENTKKCRIRLSSLEISEINEELVELFQDKRLCNHLHIPLQSGNEKILRLMRRNYTPEKFTGMIKRISERVDNVSIGSDIIVGFPEEGEKEFNDTLSMINDLPFTYLHIFPFSARPGTEAYNMKNLPLQSEVKNRLKSIREIAVQKKRNYLNRQLNKSLETVIEDRTPDGFTTGTSSNYLKIRIRSDVHEKGSIVNVRSVRLANDMVEGIVIL